jgi:hypothetical protein
MIWTEIRHHFRSLTITARLAILLLFLFQITYSIYNFRTADDQWPLRFSYLMYFSAWNLPGFILLITALLENMSNFKRIRFTVENEYRVNISLILISALISVGASIIPATLVVLLKLKPNLIDWLSVTGTIAIEYLMMFIMIGLVEYLCFIIFYHKNLVAVILLAFFIGTTVISVPAFQQYLYFFIFVQSDGYGISLIPKIIFFGGLVLCMLSVIHFFAMKQEGLKVQE